MMHCVTGDCLGLCRRTVMPAMPMWKTWGLCKVVQAALNPASIFQMGGRTTPTGESRIADKTSLLRFASRKLLYLSMISGDGNFHLHSYSKVNDEFESPSVFGDFGFWVPHEIGKKYTEFADSQKTYASVRPHAPPPTHMLTFLLCRKWVLATRRLGQ
jgi:hypothetical protein